MHPDGFLRLLNPTPGEKCNSLPDGGCLDKGGECVYSTLWLDRSNSIYCVIFIMMDFITAGKGN